MQMATFIAPHQINPVEDAEALAKAFKGLGTDEKAVISILAHRNATQRKEIMLAYEQLHQVDLVKRLESELTGKFERAVYRWMFEAADRDAVLANIALKKSGGIDYPVIIEIACIHSPEELLAVRRAYQARYKHSLEEDLAVSTIGNTRNLLVSLVTAYRYDSNEIDEKLARTEAVILHKAFKDKTSDEDEVIRILTTRSKAQLKAIFNRYRDEHGTSVTKSLLAEATNDYMSALRTTIHCIDDPEKYFEKVLSNALKGAGIDDNALTRVIVTRAEKDLKKIMEQFYKKNSISLGDAVAKDTTGDYKAFLLALLGNEK